MLLNTKMTLRGMHACTVVTMQFSETYIQYVFGLWEGTRAPGGSPHLNTLCGRKYKLYPGGRFVHEAPKTHSCKMF